MMIKMYILYLIFKLKEKLIGSEDIQKKYLELKKLSNSIESDSKKVLSDEFDEKEWKIKGARIQKNINNFEKLYEKFKTEVEKGDNIDDGTSKKISDLFNDLDENIFPLIEKINEKTSNYSLNSNNQDDDDINNNGEEPRNGDGEGEGEGNQVIQDLQNNQEILEERRKQLEDISRTSSIILDMTKDMSKKIEDQGVILDDVEENVMKTEDNAEKAKVEIQKANEYSKGNRKRLCCIILIAAVAVFTVGGIVLSIVLNQS